MRNFFTIYYGYFKNSKKIILISIIGLTCALGLISSSVLYIDNSKSEISNRIINSTSNSDYDIAIDYSINYPYINTIDFANTVNKFAQNLSNNLDVNIFSNLELTYSASQFFTTQKSPTVNPLTKLALINNSVVIVELNPALKQDLEGFLSNNSSFNLVDSNSNSNITQAFALQSDALLTTNPNINFYQHTNLINKSLTKVYLGGSVTTQTFLFNITGVGKLITTYSFNTKTNTYTLNDQLNKYSALKSLILSNEPIETFLFVNNITRFLYSMNLNYDSLPHFTADGGYKINFNKIDVLLLSSKLSAISLFQVGLQNKIVNSNYFAYHESYNPSIKVTFATESVYQSITSTTNLILYYIVLYSFPILIVALFMVSYSFGLIYKKQMEIIAIYRTRGLPRLFVLAIALGDLVLVAVLSALLSYILGFPIAALATKSNFLLSFNNQPQADLFNIFLTNLTAVMEILTVCSIIFSILVNFFKILHLLNTPIEITQNPNELSEPFWKRFYLDFLLFFYGIISYEIVNYFISNPDYAQKTTSIAYIILSLGIPSPFFIVFGLLLIVMRIIPVVINWLGTKLWISKGNLLAFTLKDLVRYSQTSTKAIILIASLISFIFIFYTVPVSQVNYIQQTSLFDTGAEGVLQITNFESNLTYIREMIYNISSILNSNFSNSLTAYSPFYSVVINNIGISSYNFIFINSSNYVQASEINLFQTGLRNDISKDFSALRSENNSVLINKKASALRGIGINDKLYIPINDYQTIKLPVVDIFNEWPATSKYSWDTGLYAIADMNVYINAPVNSYQNSAFSKINNFGFYLNFKNGLNRTIIAQNLEKVFGSTVKLSYNSISDWNVIDGLIIQFQIGQININVLLSLIIVLLILVMFSYMQLYEKKDELQTLRSLGLNALQTNYLFLIELGILIILGLILGCLVGTFLIQLLTIFMSQGNTIPSYIVIIPWNLIIVTLIGIILVTIIESVVSSYLIIKREIAQTLF